MLDCSVLDLVIPAGSETGDTPHPLLRARKELLGRLPFLAHALQLVLCRPREELVAEVGDVGVELGDE
jgi:hypothetical protein